MDTIVPSTSGVYCKEWATPVDSAPLPSATFLTGYMVTLTVSALILGISIRMLRRESLRALLRDAGVALKKVQQTSKEIERKTFHLAGLLVPLIYQVLLQYGFTQDFCVRIVWSITIVGCTADMMRIHVPFVQRNWPLKSILREKEQGQLCGGFYFALGCTLTIHFFEPVIAMTSIIYLVMGDMTAALVGRSFGKSIVALGIGPEGKKSVEGSTAMFAVCVVFGCSIFSQVHLREYAVILASLAATLVEVYEPFGINDNVSIPVLASVALTFGFARTYKCEPARSPLSWGR
uniref:Dolichol kinase n=1 Tax=Noctiluca scintillans TaxID=2966 RepID=A0A7S1FAI7_NOCSC|mmetsp:Transcript_47816/g.126570  ORF Transcript_47816/g.126570 Transcript_47816/m.126570 type:complete len:291 (+) Transcript_47816:82-954(+)